MSMTFIKKLLIPKEVKAMYPLSEDMVRQKAERDEAIKKIITGTSRRFLLIMGPCSADREDAVMTYMEKLAGIQEKVKDKLFIIPRLYTEKPRSSGKGYMGLMHQPNPKEAENLYEGILSVRRLNMAVLKNTGLTCADEFLYPEPYRYFSDLLSYVVVGARSTENQQHRLTASGLDIPVGFKNPMGGNLNAMVQSVSAAQSGHHFLYRGWEVESTGNSLAHAVLRGYTDIHGAHHPNYGAEAIYETLALFEQHQVINPTLMVDVNHSNSKKNYEKQVDVAMAVMESRRKDPKIAQTLKGLMIESYLEDGQQAPGGNCFGRSITDPCLGWEKSERLIYDLAEWA